MTTWNHEVIRKIKKNRHDLAAAMVKECARMYAEGELETESGVLLNPELDTVPRSHVAEFWFDFSKLQISVGIGPYEAADIFVREALDHMPCPNCDGSGKYGTGFDSRDPASGYTVDCPCETGMRKDWLKSDQLRDPDYDDDNLLDY